MSKMMRTAAQTAVLMAVFTLISKVFGFVREMIMANFFGTSYITDAYVMAIAIPGIIFGGVFASIGTAYMPLLSETTEKEGENAANRFTSEVLHLILLIAVVVTILGILFCKQIVSLFAGGFTRETLELTVIFTKITFSYVLFTAMTSIFESYLQYKGAFLIQIVLGYVQNIIVIAVIVISAYTSFYYLTVGWLLAYVIKAIFLVAFARKKGFSHKKTFQINKVAKRMLFIAIPVFVSSTTQQINTFVDKTLASRFQEGSVAALNYSMILITLIIGLTAAILTTIFFPKLNQARVLKNEQRFNDLLSRGSSLIIMIAVPCTLGVLFYSHQVVQIVYERGIFDALATNMTSSVFFYYGIGLTFMALNELILRAYYAIQDTKTPMIFAGISVIINISLSLILSHIMGYSGLALATSIASMANTVLLVVGMRKKHANIMIFESIQKLLKIIAAAVISVGTSYLVYSFVIIPMQSIIYVRILQLALAVLVAGIMYLILLYCFKIDEIKILKQLGGR